MLLNVLYAHDDCVKSVTVVMIPGIWTCVGAVRLLPPPCHPPNPSICAGAVQSGDGFLSLLRHVQLFLALHRGPVPLHSPG